jgi:hypothetical protein
MTKCELSHYHSVITWIHCCVDCTLTVRQPEVPAVVLRGTKHWLAQCLCNVQDLKVETGWIICISEKCRLCLLFYLFLSTMNCVHSHMHSNYIAGMYIPVCVTHHPHSHVLHVWSRTPSLFWL